MTDKVESLSKIKMPKIKLKAPDLSKINLRKINWTTVMAVMAYLHILVFIPMYYGRKSSFVQFHARQGFVLLFVWVLFAYAMYLPVVPLFLAWYLIVSVLGGIISVLRGQERKLLFIGKKIGAPAPKLA